MTDIDKRIDEIMEYIREIDSDFFCTCCESSDADRLICAGGIIAELQAQVVELETLILDMLPMCEPLNQKQDKIIDKAKAAINKAGE